MGRAQSKKEKDNQRLEIYRGRRSKIAEIRKIVRDTAFFDKDKRELLCMNDFFNPQGTFILHYQGEVLMDLRGHGSLQKLD